MNLNENSMRDQAVKALIALSISVEDADKVVRNFNEDLNVDETVEVLKKKHDYVQQLFNSDRGFSCPIINSTEFEIASTNYYGLLSILVLRKWRE